MSSLKALGIVGTGSLGVLTTGLFVSNALHTGFDWLFGLAIIVFVGAGATALIARAI